MKSFRTFGAHVRTTDLEGHKSTLFCANPTCLLRTALMLAIEEDGEKRTMSNIKMHIESMKEVQDE